MLQILIKNIGEPYYPQNGDVINLTADEFKRVRTHSSEGLCSHH